MSEKDDFCEALLSAHNNTRCFRKFVFQDKSYEIRINLPQKAILATTAGAMGLAGHAEYEGEMGFQVASRNLLHRARVRITLVSRGKLPQIIVLKYYSNIVL